MDFTHLHIHGTGSLLDGLPFPEEIIDRAVTLGHKAIALTEHGSLSTSLQFYEAARAKGIKPILGVEGYFTKDHTSRDKDDKIYHMGLLAKTYEGYQNLCALSDIAWNKGFYKRPRFDITNLLEHKAGLIMLSGCMDGVVSYHLRTGEEGKALGWHELFAEEFGENYFVEIQPWNPQGLNADLITLAKATGTRIVATADAHYCTQEDQLAEEVSLLMNQTKQLKMSEKDIVASKFKESRERISNPMARINFLYPDRKLRFDKINNYIMSKKNLELKMLDAGYDVPEAYSNTLLVADMVEDYDLPVAQDYLPRYSKSMDSNFYLRDLAQDALQEKGFGDNEEYKARLEEELHVIESLNFSNYMLIIWDMCNWAHTNSIMVGTGRGSVGGSLLAFLLGITRVDPLKHGLLFWRFLNMDESGKSARTDPPDIDTDFEDRRRDDVKTYMINRWKNVASICAWNKFTAKGTVRDLSRVFAVPLTEVNAVCKNFSNLEEFLSAEKTAKFRSMYPEVAELAKKFEGRWRFSTVHAAGMVVADRPLDAILPLESRDAGSRARDRIRVTAFDMDDVQRLGLIKFDVLGVAALSVVHDALDMIEKNKGIKVDIDSIDLEDPAVLNEFTLGHTVGAFQVDTASYTHLLRNMKVDSFNDLMASNALVRPGPLLTVTPQYIDRKHGRKETPSENPLIWDITKDTYGLIIYQEQLMQALVTVGGFSQFEADKVRKIISKKRDPEQFKPFEEQWMLNASEVVGKTKAAKYWKDFLKFAGYAFNKSHACAYSIISYQTMWLKKYYPIEYMWALLNNESDKNKVTTFVFEAKRLGIKVGMPDINASGVNFTIEDDNSIRYGLTNVFGIGVKAAEEIVTQRPYESMDDFAEKVSRRKCNTTAINALTNVGAFMKIHDTDIAYEDFYYELLGYAQSLTEEGFDIPGIEVTPISEATDKTVHIVRALVKSVDSKPDYTKVELEDMSSSNSYFCPADTPIEAGKLALCLVRDADFIGITYIDDFKQRLEEGGELNRFEKYLLGEVFEDEMKLYNHDVGRFDAEKVLVLPLSVRAFKIKNGRLTGQLMASMLVTDGEEVQKVVVFPKSYKNCAQWLTPFVPIVMRKQYTKSGDLTVTEDGIRLANRLMRDKGLIG